MRTIYSITKHCWLAIGSVLLVLALPNTAKSQRIQPSNVGTAQSALIQAQADYVVAQGMYLKSAAEARQKNAEAAEHEMKNSVLWVQTYFERRRLNREARAEEDPGYQENERRRKELFRQILATSPEQMLTADVHKRLNTLLKDMLATISYDTFLYDSELMRSPENQPLSNFDIQHLRLREVSDRMGNAQTFGADDGEVLKVRWPALLREPEYDAVRREFELARDDAVATLKSGKNLNHDQERQLTTAVRQLAERLTESFDPTVESTTRNLMFVYAERYVSGDLIKGTQRMIEVGKDAVATDTRKFSGNTVVELLQHMMSQGFEFAEPKPGDEAAYRKMFSLIRSIYQKTNPGAPATALADKNEVKKAEAATKSSARTKNITGK